MQTSTVALIFLVGIVAFATGIGGVFLYRRKIRRAQSEADEVRRKAAEEQHREVEQEAVQKAKEEEQHWAEEAERYEIEAELQRAHKELRRTEEEHKPLEEEAYRETEQVTRKAEEGNRKLEESQEVGEETRRNEEAQRKTEEQQRLKAETESKQIEPGKRGGRPRVSTEAQEEQLAQETKPRRPKPEIICWKREREWILAVEVPEELLENSGLAVLQDGSPLPQDESREACWRLEQTLGEVVVQWNEGEGIQKTSFALGQEDYLLFKLSGRNQNQGRRVKSPSFGWYLVMAPETWERDEALSGPSPVAPESVSLAGYQAHFFFLAKGGDGEIAFRSPEGKLVVIAPKASQFQLVGTRLNDASEHRVPLFGEGPPRIRALDEWVWKDVGTIVVGEEGSGRGRWRMDFCPERGEVEQSLPSEVAARKGGWYFLRFYNTNDDLIESLDFRFLCVLKEIRIPPASPLPSEDGHRPACVEFLHEPICAVQPADGLVCNIPIEREGDKTILIVPPDPTYDETHWLVGPNGLQVEVTILVERLWWALGEEEHEPSQWRDKPLSLSRDDFTAISTRTIWLRFPRSRWVNKISIGFERAKARLYPVEVAKKTLAVPLREFVDSQEVADRVRPHRWTVWIERNGTLEGVIAILPASQIEQWIGRGRYKTAEARAILQDGRGSFAVNGKPVGEYFKNAPAKARNFLQRLQDLLREYDNILSRWDVQVEVWGSSPTTMRQAKAVTHALARALMGYDPTTLKPDLNRAGFGGSKVPSRRQKDRRNGR